MVFPTPSPPPLYESRKGANTEVRYRALRGRILVKQFATSRDCGENLHTKFAYLIPAQDHLIVTHDFHNPPKSLSLFYFVGHLGEGLGVVKL